MTMLFMNPNDSFHLLLPGKKIGVIEFDVDVLSKSLKHIFGWWTITIWWRSFDFGLRSHRFWIRGSWYDTILKNRKEEEIFIGERERFCYFSYQMIIELRDRCRSIFILILLHEWVISLVLVIDSEASYTSFRISYTCTFDQYKDHNNDNPFDHPRKQGKCT